MTMMAASAQSLAFLCNFDRVGVEKYTIRGAQRVLGGHAFDLKDLLVVEAAVRHFLRWRGL